MDNLQILNGILDPVFNENVYEYNVTIDENVISLVFDYEVINESATVTIYGNENLAEGENHVLLEVYDKDLKTYTFNVLKTASTSGEITPYEKVEVPIQNEVFEDILTPSIAIICFFSIVVLFLIIFKKSKS